MHLLYLLILFVLTALLHYRIFFLFKTQNRSVPQDFKYEQLKKKQFLRYRGHRNGTF